MTLADGNRRRAAVRQSVRRRTYGAPLIQAECGALARHQGPDCRRSGRGDISSDRSPEVAASGTVTAACPTRRPCCPPSPRRRAPRPTREPRRAQVPGQPRRIHRAGLSHEQLPRELLVRSPVVEPTVSEGFIGRLHRASLARVERWRTAPDRHRNEHLRADADPPGLIRSIHRSGRASWPQARSSLRSSAESRVECAAAHTPARCGPILAS